MSYTKLNIKELQARLDAISEDADGKDIPVNKDIKLAGDSRYGKGKNPESVFVTKVEILLRGDEDGVAMADVFVEHDGPMEIYTDSGFEAEISKIVGFKVDFTESGMQQPGRASLEGLSQVSEYSITTRDERDFDQEDFNLAHAVTVLANKLIADAGDRYDGKFLTQREYYNDASEQYGYSDLEEVPLPAYGDLEDDDMEKFMANYKEPAMQKAESVEEQVNEDLIDAGSPLEDILEMNLFMDMLNVNPKDCPAGSDEMVNVNSDREFKGLDYLVTRDLCAKYKPIAMQLAKEIEAQADRELTEDEVDMLNEVWYEASDLYQNGDVSELARIYDEQIQLIKQLLSSANESVEEGDAELAELKSALGRTGGVMGFTQ